MAIGMIDCQSNLGYMRWSDLNVDKNGYILEYQVKQVYRVIYEFVEENDDWFSKADMIGIEFNRGSRQKTIVKCLKDILIDKGKIVRDINPKSFRGQKNGFGHAGPKTYLGRKKASLTVPLLNMKDLNEVRMANNQTKNIDALNKRKSEKTDMIEALIIAAYVRKNYVTLLMPKLTKSKRKFKIDPKTSEPQKVKDGYKTRVYKGPYELLLT